MHCIDLYWKQQIICDYTNYSITHCLILILRSFLCFCDALFVQKGAADYDCLWPSTPSPQSVLIWQLLLWIQSHWCDASHISYRNIGGSVELTDGDVHKKQTNTPIPTPVCSMNMKYWTSSHLCSMVWDLLSLYKELLTIVYFCQQPYFKKNHSCHLHFL